MPLQTPACVPTITASAVAGASTGATGAATTTNAAVARQPGCVGVRAAEATASSGLATAHLAAVAREATTSAFTAIAAVPITSAAQRSDGRVGPGSLRPACPHGRCDRLCIRARLFRPRRVLRAGWLPHEAPPHETDRVDDRSCRSQHQYDTGRAVHSVIVPLYH